MERIDGNILVSSEEGNISSFSIAFMSRGSSLRKGGWWVL
jgi:hypothetical protein